jgi:hypothetical protein
MQLIYEGVLAFSHKDLLTNALFALDARKGE